MPLNIDEPSTAIAAITKLISKEAALKVAPLAELMAEDVKGHVNKVNTQLSARKVFITDSEVS
jgi:hypothetical protein